MIKMSDLQGDGGEKKKDKSSFDFSFILKKKKEQEDKKETSKENNDSDLSQPTEDNNQENKDIAEKEGEELEHLSEQDSKEDEPEEISFLSTNLLEKANDTAKEESPAEKFSLSEEDQTISFSQLDNIKPAKPQEDAPAEKDNEFTQIDFSSAIDKKKEETIDKKIEEEPKQIKNEPTPIIDFSFAVGDEAKKNVEEQSFFPSQKHVEVHDRAIDIAEKILDSSRELTSNDIDDITKIVGDIVDIIVTDEQEMFEAIFALPLDKKFYVINLVNVCVLSLELAQGLNYNREQSIKLGIAALLHDVGMRTMIELIEQDRKLSTDEFNIIKQHPSLGAELLKEIDTGLDLDIIKAISQEHERFDSSGYPNHVDGGGISEYAQIIGLIDVYEALVHNRPYRTKKYDCVEAVKSIIGNKNLFNPKLIKTFLERIGMYPRGIRVELNTKEVAVVAGQNFKMPFCPLVRVAYDSRGQEIVEKREVDLSKGTKIYITKVIKHHE